MIELLFQRLALLLLLNQLMLNCGEFCEDFVVFLFNDFILNAFMLQILLEALRLVFDSLLKGVLHDVLLLVVLEFDFDFFILQQLDVFLEILLFELEILEVQLLDRLHFGLVLILGDLHLPIDDQVRVHDALLGYFQIFFQLLNFFSFLL